MTDTPQAVHTLQLTVSGVTLLEVGRFQTTHLSAIIFTNHWSTLLQGFETSNSGTFPSSAYSSCNLYCSLQCQRQE